MLPCVSTCVLWYVKLLHVCTLIQVELNNNTDTANNNQLPSSRGHDDDGVNHEGPDRHASLGIHDHGSDDSTERSTTTAAI